MILLPPWFHAVAGWIGTTSWQAAILVLLILAVQRLGKRWLSARWTYALWLLVVIRLLLPALPSSPISLFRFFPASSGPATRPTPTPAEPSDSPVPGVPSPAPSSLSPDAPRTAIAPPSPWGLHWFLLLWALGGAAVLSYFLTMQALLLIRLRRASTAREYKINRILHEVRNELNIRVPVRLLELDRLNSPSLAGFFRPCLLLPKQAWRSWSEEDCRWIMRHELTHLRRGDVLLNWVLMALQTLHWFNPLIWIAFRRLRADRELVCDEAVVKHGDAQARQAYGESLVQVARWRASCRPAWSVIPLSGHASQLRRRIERLVHPRPIGLGSSLVAWAMAAAVTALGMTGAAPPSGRPPSSVLLGQRSAWSLANPTAETVPSRPPAVREESAIQVAPLKISPGASVADSSALPLLSLASLLEYERVLAAWQTRRREAAALLEQSQSPPSADRTASILAATSDRLLASLAKRRMETQHEVWKQSGLLAPSHPELAGLSALLALLDRQIAEREAGILASEQLKANALRASYERLRSELDRGAAQRVESQIEQRYLGESPLAHETEWQLAPQRDRRSTKPVSQVGLFPPL